MPRLLCLWYFALTELLHQVDEDSLEFAREVKFQWTQRDVASMQKSVLKDHQA